jgi:hypothetical protein
LTLHQKHVSPAGPNSTGVAEGLFVPGDTSQQESSQQDSADRRTRLAADRTVFAAERTYAAWVRTGLAALASGVGARKLLEGVVADWMIWGVGTNLVLFSAFSVVLNEGECQFNPLLGGWFLSCSKLCPQHMGGFKFRSEHLPHFVP